MDPKNSNKFLDVFCEGNIEKSQALQLPKVPLKLVMTCWFYLCLQKNNLKALLMPNLVSLMPSKNNPSSFFQTNSASVCLNLHPVSAEKTTKNCKFDKATFISCDCLTLLNHRRNPTSLRLYFKKFCIS